MALWKATNGRVKFHMCRTIFASVRLQFECGGIKQGDWILLSAPFFPVPQVATGELPHDDLGDSFQAEAKSRWEPPQYAASYILSPLRADRLESGETLFGGPLRICKLYKMSRLSRKGQTASKEFGLRFPHNGANHFGFLLSGRSRSRMCHSGVCISCC